MVKNLLIATAALLVFGFTASAQTSAPKYEQHNKWMVGAEVSYNTNNHYGIGPKATYGRQYSEILFLGIGFGVDMYVYDQGDMSMTITHPDGTQTIKTQPPYAFDFLVPVYADLQVNFSRKRSPFFAEFKLGGALDFELERVRGTKNTNKLELWGGGILFGAAIGKRFALNGDNEINVTIGWDGIIWPWYINAPLSIGVRYGF